MSPSHEGAVDVGWLLDVLVESVDNMLPLLGLAPHVAVSKSYQTLLSSYNRAQRLIISRLLDSPIWELISRVYKGAALHEPSIRRFLLNSIPLDFVRIR